MKRTYLAKRNAILSRENLSWGSGALAFALIMLVLRLVAPDAFVASVTPAIRLSQAMTAGSRTFFSSFADVAALSAKNENLMIQNVAFANENQMLMQKVADLTALFREVGASAESIVAGVTLRPPESPYDTFLVNVGSNSGVTLGMGAFGPGGVPLGSVTEVAEKSARITLFSAPGMHTGGWVGTAKIPLALTGHGGGVLDAVVSRSAPIVVGDIVYVPGPGALPIGSVMRIDSDPTSPSVTLRIKNALNLFSVMWVELRAL